MLLIFTGEITERGGLLFGRYYTIFIRNGMEEKGFSTATVCG